MQLCNFTHKICRGGVWGSLTEANASLSLLSSPMPTLCCFFTLPYSALIYLLNIRVPNFSDSDWTHFWFQFNFFFFFSSKLTSLRNTTFLCLHQFRVTFLHTPDLKCFFGRNTAILSCQRYSITNPGRRGHTASMPNALCWCGWAKETWGISCRQQKSCTLPPSAQITSHIGLGPTIHPQATGCTDGHIQENGSKSHSFGNHAEVQKPEFSKVRKT